jgi:hypothetical protein
MPVPPYIGFRKKLNSYGGTNPAVQAEAASSPDIVRHSHEENHIYLNSNIEHFVLRDK